MKSVETEDVDSACLSVLGDSRAKFDHTLITCCQKPFALPRRHVVCC